MALPSRYLAIDLSPSFFGRLLRTRFAICVSDFLHLVASGLVGVIWIHHASDPAQQRPVEPFGIVFLFGRHHFLAFMFDLKTMPMWHL
jgi:hypothetical protein